MDRPNFFRALAKRILRALPLSMRTFVKHTFWMMASRMSEKDLE